MTTTRTLVIERELAYPPEKVWRALTEGPLLREWLLENDFQPIVGHGFQFRATPAPNWDGIIQSKVLAVEPPRKLSYTWGSLGLETVVVWTLSPTASGTLLRMEQSGFGPDQDRAYKGANYGWQMFLGKMEPLLARMEG